MPAIKDLSFENPLLLGPMAGVTDSAFRSVCRRFGAAGCYTEMVSAKALTYHDKKTRELLFIAPEEHPCGAQIFGSDPSVCAEAAVMALEISGADFLDINMGCPVPKIVNNGEGSALMRDPAAAERLIAAVRKKISVPLTVKFRKGFDEDHCNAVEFARMAESAGADALCVHGRTRRQMYAGKSDFSIIEQVKQAVSVPVIASGDMFTGEDAANALRRGIDFVMVARGAQGDPLVFRRMLAALENRPCPPQELADLLAIMQQHIALMCERKGEARAIPEARKHILWYLKGVSGAKPYKLRFAQVASRREIAELCGEMLRQLA